MDDKVKAILIMLTTILVISVMHLNARLNNVTKELSGVNNIATEAYDQSYYATDQAEDAYSLAEEAIELVDEIDYRISY
jgi:hypothetical protein